MLLSCNFFIHYLFLAVSIVFSLSPETSLFDAYGLKLAANDFLVIESLNSQEAFFLRLAPFNYSLSCTVPYNVSDQYIYAVAVHRQATTNNSNRFVFIGVNTETDVPFIGSFTYNGTTGAEYVASVQQTRKTKFPCNGWQTTNYRLHQFHQFASDTLDENSNDFFVVIVGPTGHFAYAFAKNFLVVYNLDADNVSTQLGNLTWPDPSFLPRAVDVNRDSLFVVLGYVGDSSTQYMPCAYLLNASNSSLFVLDTWLYTAPTNNSWQVGLTNQDADVYSEKYDMSVSVNDNNNQVLLGIQIMNTIVLLDINQITNTFGLTPQTLSNGKSIGMGKAVGWLDMNLAVVLVNTYSFNYVWSSSQIVVYNVSIPNNFLVMAILPNIQQQFVPTFGPVLLSLVATQSGTLIMFDSDGDYYILLPSPAGSFSDSSSRSSSTLTPCIGGTFSPQLSILPCSLCPTGTTTDGLIGQSSCVPCDDDVFCSLGAASRAINLSSPYLENVNQVYAYPESPQSTRFDNILIQNMFVIHAASSQHCLLVSPLFWALIVILFGIVVWLVMFLLKHCVENPRGEIIRQFFKRVLKKTDLIGEGEFVIGGLFSFAIIVLIVFAYTFSSAYYNRYPIEQISSSANFACDPTLSNAQFYSGLMTTGIPPNDLEAPIFSFLDDQPLTLYVEFINTLFKCTDVTATQIKDTNLDMTISSCSDSNNVVSVSLPLPSHSINMQVLLADTNTVGGLRMRLEGPGVYEENESLEAVYTLGNLTFAQVFSVSDRLLTQQPSCTLQLVKVINYTYPLSEGGYANLSAIWLPSFSTNLDQMFVDENEYKHATNLNTVLSIVISEASYYMLNTQKPITDEAEMIFANLLFTIVCLEIFGLGFLVFKLIISPNVQRLVKYCRQRITKKGKERKEDFDQPYMSSSHF